MASCNTKSDTKILCLNSLRKKYIMAIITNVYELLPYRSCSNAPAASAHSSTHSPEPLV